VKKKCHQIECGCGRHAHVSGGGWHYRWSYGCAPDYAPQCFPTREEIIERLEEYLKQLRAEARGVEEHLAELRKEG